MALVSIFAAQAGAEVVHHNIQASFLPENRFISATDHVIFFVMPKDGVYRFQLASGLTVRNSDARRFPVDSWQVPVIQHKDGRISAEIVYEGTVYSPITDGESDGLIDAAGISLFGSSRWYPQREDDLVTFSLNVNLPTGWSFVTQNSSNLQPQEQIYFIAAPFFNYYGLSGSSPSLSMHLRSQDVDLVKKYFEKIPEFIRHYTQTIAPYPYRSFQVVENFWETGFGMPSFTLLGSSVIRLPFLLTTSLPHEILHNWWGNGVYVDYARGNWSEGLTSYMADHWQQSVIGEGAEFRRSTIAGFQDYVREANDFPVRRFRGRHGAGTQAVGYGKSMFFFHMLKAHLGDEVFARGLREFYKTNLFARAGFDDIQSAMEVVSGMRLHAFFQQWLDRTGLPTLKLVSATTIPKSRGFGLNMTLRQESGTGPYDLRVPVVLTLRDGSIQRLVLPFNAIEHSFSLPTRAAVKRVAVDPDFDIFRALYREEHTPSVSLILSAPKAHFLSAPNRDDTAAFIDVWKSGYQQSTQTVISENHPLPQDGALIFVGPSSVAQNLFNDSLAEQGVHVNDEAVVIGEQAYSRAEHALALVTRLGDQPAIWVFWPAGTDVSRLASRLRYYASFGAVGFKGQPNVLKRPWRVVHSPLTKSY